MFDVLTIAAVADELRDTVLDGRIQQVGLLSKRAIGLEIYAGGRRRHLVASAENDDPRLLLAARPPAFDAQLVTPFLLLLRKYVRGGMLLGIDQPPLERIVRLSIAKRLKPHNAPFDRVEDAVGTSASEMEREEEEDFDGIEDATFVTISIEIMGRHSNIILIDDDGRIMESVKRVSPTMSRVRPIAPKLRFIDPPAAQKSDPRRLTATECASLLGKAPANENLARSLPRTLAGVSPQMAKEIAFLATGSVETRAADVTPQAAALIARETRRLLEPLLTGAWRPMVYRDAEGGVEAYAPIPLGHLAARLAEEQATSISAAAEAAEGERDNDATVRHAQRRLRLIESIASVEKRAATKLGALKDEMEKSREVERWRASGEAIYANLWSIAPRQTALVVEGESIPLDPELSAKENAQAYFERYRRAQGANGHLPALMTSATLELTYLEQLRTLIGQATAFADIEALAVEWDRHQRGSGSVENAKRPLRRSAPPKRTRPMWDAHGNAIYVGRSGTENDAITFDIGGPNDTWLHARGVPGSHVLVRWRNAAGEEHPDTIERAAAVAAHYSAGRASGSVEVDVTRRRNVRKIKGAGAGMVTYRNERTVSVHPAGETETGWTAQAP